MMIGRRRDLCIRCQKTVAPTVIYCVCGEISERRAGLLADIVKELAARSQLLFRAGVIGQPMTERASKKIFDENRDASLTSLEKYVVNAKRDRAEARGRLQAIERYRARVAILAARVALSVEEIEEGVGRLGALKKEGAEHLILVLEKLPVLGGDFERWWQTSPADIAAEITSRERIIREEKERIAAAQAAAEAPF